MDHFQRDSVMVEQFLNGILLMQKQLDIKIGKKKGGSKVMDPRLYIQ